MTPAEDNTAAAAAAAAPASLSEVRAAAAAAATEAFFKPGTVGKFLKMGFGGFQLGAVDFSAVGRNCVFTGPDGRLYVAFAAAGNGPSAFAAAAAGNGPIALHAADRNGPIAFHADDGNRGIAFPFPASSALHTPGNHPSGFTFSASSALPAAGNRARGFTFSASRGFSSASAAASELGAADCGGIPPGATQAQHMLLQRIEDVRAEAFRDSAVNKRYILRLTDELNGVKAVSRDVVSMARRQIGVIAFRMFLGMGALLFISMTYNLRQFGTPPPTQPNIVMVPSIPSTPPTSSPPPMATPPPTITRS